MTHEVSDIPDFLNHLISVLRDGEVGYAEAAKDVGNSELASIFRTYAEQRRKLQAALSHEVSHLGETPAGAGTVSGALHRGWLNVKSAMTGANPESIVAACETGDDAGAAEFENAMDVRLPGDLHALIARGAQQIREAHSHMLRLKTEMKSGVEFPASGH